MKIIKYFFQFLIISFLFFLFKIFGYKYSSDLGSILGKYLGPFFRSKKIIMNNLKRVFPDIEIKEINILIKDMWSNYGRILSDYIFIKNLRISQFDKYIEIEGTDILKKIKDQNQPVIFVSGHFNNFELLAMSIEKSGIDLAAIYRPLNNIFLNKTMEKIRVNYICKNQIPKGLGGVKDMLNFFNKGTSLALMIDQRVSQGTKINFFKKPAYTTTIPAQFVKKFKCPVVPMHIERINKYFFKINVENPIYFNEALSIDEITLHLNLWIEKKIKKNPNQWIWSHNRWK
jgi:Kdo2-lipid IVA lauroyltransferase/acyltransferase